MNIGAQSLLKITGRLELGKTMSLASPVLAIGVSILISLFVVWPKFSEVLRLRAANEQLEIRSGALQEKAQTLQSLDRELLEKQLVAGEQLLPSDKGVFTLVAQIERAAAASGVILSRVEVSPGSIDGTFDDKPAAGGTSGKGSGGATDGTEADASPKIQLKVSVESNYKSFLQFLGNMLSISRVVSVKDMAISSAADTGQIKVSLTVDAFWQALPKDLPSIETPIEKLTDSELARLEQIQETGLVTAPIVPSVPLGRSDLFAPF